MNRNIRYVVMCMAVVVPLSLWVSAAGSKQGGTHGMLPPVNREAVWHEYLFPQLMPYIDSAANVITDSCGNLIPAMEKLLALRSGGQGQVSILHIGDSHVQADYWTGRVRELFQRNFGNAGRGLITPLRMARSNEAPDYAIRTALEFNYYKIPDGQAPYIGPTGVAITFRGTDCGFEIWSKNPFDAVTILHHERAPMLRPEEALRIGSECTIENTPTSTRIVLSRHIDTLRLGGSANAMYDNPTFYGFSLENGRPGVLYHVAGSNGAAFEHFSWRTTIPEGGAAPLHPDLIIISLGTNNCYGGNYQSAHLRETVDAFIAKIKSSYPGAAILVTTPFESCRKIARRRYEVNRNVADAAAVIRAAATAAGVACWDLFAAAGGEGSHKPWHETGIMRDDHIHLTDKGYTMVGDMMYDAFARYYNAWLGAETEGCPGEQEVQSQQAAPEAGESTGGYVRLPEAYGIRSGADPATHGVDHTIPCAVVAAWKHPAPGSNAAQTETTDRACPETAGYHASETAGRGRRSACNATLARAYLPPYTTNAAPGQ